jgi:hypothetical protein
MDKIPTEKSKAFNFLEGNMREYLYDLEIRMNFPPRHTKKIAK